MWGRLADVAGNVAGYVVPGNEDEGELRQQLEDTQEELRTARSLIEQRDQEIISLSTAVSATPLCEETCDDLERLRQKLALFTFDDPEQIEDVISNISFSLSEKSSTITQLQSVIDSLKEKQQDYDTELPTNSPSSDDFYESQILRLTELCTCLRNKEKNSATAIEQLKCELTDAKAEIQHLQHSSTDDKDGNDAVLRLEEENRLLLAKVASEAAHKDILRDQLEELRENQQEKFHFLENIKELQDALQQKSADLSAEKQKSDALTTECDNLQHQLTQLLSEKQRKIQKNLFEGKEDESLDEELDRVKVENAMIISKISDLMTERDKAREEIETLQERHGTSRDALIRELQEKEHELEDSMTIVSLLQEQIKSGHGSMRVTALLEENTLLPKVESLERELDEAKKQLQCHKSQEEGKTGSDEEVIEEEDKGSRLPSVSEVGPSGEHPSQGSEDQSELTELITTAELPQEQCRMRSSTPHEVEHLQAEVERLSDCLRAREELIAGLREDLNQGQAELLAELLAGATQVLVELGVPLDRPDEEGWTPLHVAARRGHTAAVRVLVDAGATLDRPDEEGRTPLHEAARLGHTAAVRVLVAAGATLDRPDYWGSTPLHEAAAEGHTAAVHELVYSGAPLDRPDDRGRTPLHVAARRCHTAAVRVLVELGATLDTPDNGGRTPLHEAAKWGYTAATVRELVESGCEIDRPDDEGSTPIKIAMDNDNADTVRFLIRKGAYIPDSIMNDPKFLPFLWELGWNRYKAVNCYL